MKSKIKSSKLKVKGFTLVEVLIVVSIFGIIAGISWSTFIALQPSLQLGGVVRDLTTDLRDTQQRAVREQINYGVHFSSTTREYQIIRYGGVTQEVLKKLLPGGVDFKEVTGFSNDEVVFNPYGAVREAGSVSLVNVNDVTKTIEVKPSGFVKIK